MKISLFCKSDHEQIKLKYTVKNFSYKTLRLSWLIFPEPHSASKTISFPFQFLHTIELCHYDSFFI
jgi:hypothetical protein